MFSIRFILAVLMTFQAAIGSADPVRVFAAASLRPALEEIAARPGSEADNGGTQEATPALSISYAGSGALARQVAQGAPADLVILANLDWMIWLQEQDIIDPENTEVLLSNRLVLAGPTGAEMMAALTSQTLEKALGSGRLAIGEPQSVPAGLYARQCFETAGLWESVADRLAPTESVRAALALIQRGEVPMGVVYASDIRSAPDLAVIYEVPAALHDPILYPMAALTPRGRALAKRLQGPEAHEVFLRHGFLLPERKP